MMRKIIFNIKFHFYKKRFYKLNKKFLKEMYMKISERKPKRDERSN